MSENFENVASEITATENTVSENTASASQTTASDSQNIQFSSLPNSIKDLSQFAFTGDKKKIPVYPYVVALTGHRDAELTDDVKKMATQQLRALSKEWDAKSGRTAPLIALVGISGNSELFWIDTAIKLRDEENLNINVVAVTSVPYKYIGYMISQDEFEKIDKLIPKSPEDKKGKVDAVIECPIGEDVNEYLQVFDELQDLLTGKQDVQTENAFRDELLNILLHESKMLLDMQFKEFRKFMCNHSHTLIALVEDDEKWKTTNMAGVDITAIDFEKAQKPDIKFVPYQEKLEAKKLLSDLITLIRTRNLQEDCPPEQLSDILPQFREIARNLFPQIEGDIHRTNAMIFYKLLGNVDAALREVNDSHNGITFTSIGPVVCIQTKQPSKDKPLLWKLWHWATEFRAPEVSILVKDRPDDNDYKMTNKSKWRSWWSWIFKGYKSIAQYDEIKDVIEHLGELNKTIVEKKFWIKDELYEKNEDFFRTEYKKLHPNDQAELKTPHIDTELDSLIRHFNYADQLAIRYHEKMKWNIWLYCVIFFLLLLEIDVSINIIVKIPNNPQLMCTLGIIGLIVYLFNKWLKQNKSHKRYHDFRALAEALRIQIFWRLASMSEAVPGNFRLHQIDSISWLRVALNGLETTLRPVDAMSFKQLSTNYELINKLWIAVQLQYLTGRKVSDERYKKHILYDILYPRHSKIDFLETILNLFSPKRRRISKVIFTISIIFSLPFNFAFSTWGNYVYLYHLFPLLSALYSSLAAYYEVSLAELDLKQKRQQLYPFTRVKLLLSVRLAYWQKALENLGVARENFESKLLDEKMSRSLLDGSAQTTIIKAHQENQKLLHQLGQITLNINADWLMGADDRKFDLPR